MSLLFCQFTNCVLIYDVTRSLRGKQTTLFTKLLVGLCFAVKRRATAVTINEQYAPGYKKECR